MIDKRTSLTDAIAPIPDGARIALGGNTLHRGPGAAVHELVRQGKRGLEIVKTAGAYDVDLLCAAGCVAAVSAGFVGYETPFGMAPAYRRAVESGVVEAREHACATVIAGLRAAIQGVPFMPVAGLHGSDLPAQRGFHSLRDPYSGTEVFVIPALMPDVAIVHVQEADREGNGRIVGTRFEDVLMAQAARRVILTAERIVDGALFAAEPDTVAIPGFLTAAVVAAPRGAWPFSCTPDYDYDADYLAAWVMAARDPDASRQFIAERVFAPVAAVAVG
ncbi:MAG: CoA transferase subunit A [Chloroflexota bacterium]|nr:CoA transferase subunit A [Chloroflexia bacterium]MDQ3225751.1 CoA transferase subunit A [Chloroflexota bacterium]